jgi:Rod binding domain-containing protein
VVRLTSDLLTRSIDALANGQDLSADETSAVLAEMMTGNASDIQIAAFLIALRTKGETIDELAGLARTMRRLAATVNVSRDDLLDTAGTGGGRRTFNVSTTAALIAAGAGCTVAKHGNRSATGLSGSADVLEALGARIDLPPAAVARCIEEVGFGFMFAPAHHQATRYVIAVRRELAVRTIFNFLGPLTNPAGATRQLIGVSDAAYLNVATVPENIRNGGSKAMQAYSEGLAFESMLVNELSQQMSQTMFGGSGSGGGSGSDGSSTGSADGSSSSMLGGASAYQSLIPQALTSSVMAGGGLGMADSFAQELDPSLLAAVIYAESRFRDATSHAGFGGRVV